MTSDGQATAADELWRRNLGQSSGSLAGPRPTAWWSGVPPTRTGCPGLGDDGYLRALPTLELRTCTRAEVQAYFDNGWTLTETLFAALQGDEAFYRPPSHHLRHPLIFYYVHPAVLYVNKLSLAGLLSGPLDAEFEALFETGVDEMTWDDMTKNTMRWPSIDAAHAYRARVYRVVAEVIATHPGLAAGHPQLGRADPLWALLMGFEHERIHLETSSVLIRELPLRLVRRPEAFAPLHPSAAAPPAALPEGPANPLVTVAGGTVRVGKPDAEPTYGWDNEYGGRAVDLREFAVQRQLVSNGEFAAFVAAGAYLDERCWSVDGWLWRSFRQAKWPCFWLADGPAGSGRFRLRTLFEAVPMRWDWPAIVNYHEAEAYARWLTDRERASGATPPAEAYRLPSEAEQHRMRAVGRADQANLGVRFSSESPVDGGAPAEAGALQDLRGNVWQWCADHFHPLPGFRVHRLYDDFSVPCFDGEHQMILGGSFLSSGAEAEPWARFHFRPHFFQHAGFRLVRGAPAETGSPVRLGHGGAPLAGSSEAAASPYEADAVLNEYLLMHYGAAADLMPYGFGPRDAARFPERVAELGLDAARRLGLPLRSALDLGCAVGAATFHLAGAVSGVALGVDLSERFIQAATALKRDGELAYFRKDEGELGAELVARVAGAGARERAQFRRADACSLPPELVDFDLVLLANLLCRVPSPMACLRRMGGPRGVVRKGGLLVITTPFTWMTAYTPRDLWLGGRRVGAAASGAAEADQWSADGLLSALAPEFDLLERTELPLVIREHRRKFQYIVPEAFVLRRRH